MKIAVLIVSIVFYLSCNSDPVLIANNNPANNGANRTPPPVSADGAAAKPPAGNASVEGSKPPETQNNQPRTVRDFFNLLPAKYFTLEGCDPATDKNCDRARAEYVKNYLEVEDTANGYWKSSCDGGQSCLRMALFKRPDSTYVVGVHTLHEADEINHFLEYKDGAWTDVSKQIVPEFDNAKIYELPRYGTTVQVYKKVFPEKTFSERSAKIYDLDWKDGKFSIKR